MSAASIKSSWACKMPQSSQSSLPYSTWAATPRCTKLRQTHPPAFWPRPAWCRRRSLIWRSARAAMNPTVRSASPYFICGSGQNRKIYHFCAGSSVGRTGAALNTKAANTPCGFWRTASISPKGTASAPGTARPWSHGSRHRRGFWSCWRRGLISPRPSWRRHRIRCCTKRWTRS